MYIIYLAMCRHSPDLSRFIGGLAVQAIGKISINPKGSVKAGFFLVKTFRFLIFCSIAVFQQCPQENNAIRPVEQDENREYGLKLNPDRCISPIVIMGIEKKLVIIPPTVHKTGREIPDGGSIPGAILSGGRAGFRGRLVSPDSAGRTGRDPHRGTTR